MKAHPVDTAAAQSPGPNPNPMETPAHDPSKSEADEFARAEDLDETEPESPPSQTWKHPDDGKSLSDQDQEVPLKP